MRGFRIGASVAAASAAMAIAMMPAIGSQEISRLNVPPPPTRVQRRRKRVDVTYGGGGSNTTLHARNGARECARRRRQIAKGSLTESNGLVR